MNETTHFGFETVTPDEKTRRVRRVFDTVATRYDIMNDALSLGLHRLWKHDFVHALRLRADMKILDLAGGTGDIAFGLHARQSAIGAADVTVCDINAAMLNQGRARAIDRNLLHGLEWVCGDAQTLPFPDRSFDACTIAFGIRNVTDIPMALRDIHRVLKPGGQFLCLEFSPLGTPPELMRGQQPEPALSGASMKMQEAFSGGIKKTLYDFYSFKAVPAMGKFIAGDAAPYQYLAESIRKFPDAATFESMMQAAGFARTSHRLLSAGIVAIHTGWRV